MKRLYRCLAILGCTLPAMISAAKAQCIPAEFMVADRTNIIWTEQLKISFLLTSTKEQYEATRKNWNSAGGYGLFYGSLDYDEAKNAALKEAQTRKFDYDYATHLDYTSQRLSPAAAKMYAACLEKDKERPGLVIWVSKRERGVYYTLQAFWVGGNEGAGEGKEKKLIIDGAIVIQKPVNWPKGKTQEIAVKRLSPDKDAYLSLEVSGQTKTIFLLADLPEPSKRAITYPSVLRITSGGTSDGRSPYCQRRTVAGCVHPEKPNGYLETGSGHLAEPSTTGRAGWSVIRDTPEEICIELWAATGACETEVSIAGRPAATERYTFPVNPAASASAADVPASFITTPSGNVQIQVSQPETTQ